MSEYEVGTVAVIAADFGEQGFTDARGLRFPHGWVTECGEVVDRYVTDVRPLVVLDIKAANPIGNPDAAVSNILACLRGQAGPTRACHGLADQIEAQTRPPKPPEPQGLHVEDKDGNEWAQRRDGLWVCLGGSNDHPTHGPGVLRSYADITAVRILSEGVQ